jgi:oligoribonuclease
VAGKRGKLVWMDLEMTGLEPETCHILEIATIVTDGNLRVLAEGPDLVVHNSEAQLETLSDWSRKTFTKSGLLDRVRAATVDCAEAERLTLEFVAEHCDSGSAPLCGNSIHTDRAFLYSRMRTLHDHLHYRNVDVSSFKEVLRRWYPKDYSPPKKAGLHEALADIRESIAELRYYREAFVAPNTPAQPAPPAHPANG